MEKEYTREKVLTTPSELQKKLNSPELCLIDVRPAEQFAQGHLPGAVHFDLFGLSLVDTGEAPLRAFMHMIHYVLELRGVSDDIWAPTSARRGAARFQEQSILSGLTISMTRANSNRTRN